MLANQTEIKEDLTSIKQRLTNLEQGKLSMSSIAAAKLYNQVKDEFIDLQAGFELHTTTMVEALQRKMNNNACQLSQKIKFVSN